MIKFSIIVIHTPTIPYFFFYLYIYPLDSDIRRATNFFAMTYNQLTFVRSFFFSSSFFHGRKEKMGMNNNIFVHKVAFRILFFLLHNISTLKIVWFRKDHGYLTIAFQHYYQCYNFQDNVSTSF